MYNWRDIFCSMFGCRADCSMEEEALLNCLKQNDEYEDTIRELEDRIEELELLIPHPTPPEIDYIVQKDTAWVQSQLDSMKLGIQRLPLDQTYYLTNQKNFLNIVAWDWTDEAEYIREKYDCENFAFTFKAHVDFWFNLNQVGIVIDYKMGHAYNLVFYPDGNMMLLEPQSDAMWAWNVRPNIYELEGSIVLI